jgi:hypothetical protein
MVFYCLKKEFHPLMMDDYYARDRFFIVLQLPQTYDLS